MNSYGYLSANRTTVLCSCLRFISFSFTETRPKFDGSEQGRPATCTRTAGWGYFEVTLAEKPRDKKSVLQNFLNTYKLFAVSQCFIHVPKDI